VLRGALALGAWADAREVMRALRGMEPGHWSEETFVQELLQPVSIARIVERIDAQDPDELGGLLAFAQDLGDAGVDWTTLVLAESQQRTVRQVLAEAIAGRCRDNPERLAPWLADGRWYVVRNIVHILGWIGGPAIPGLLKVALRHTDHRVRAQVVSALSQVDLKLSRPLLVHAIEGAETPLFCQVLNQLSGARDPATARFLLAFLQQERFAQRPVEERRAIYAALASVGGDEVVPELEAELFKGNWADRAQEVHRHNVARILARIGRPLARQALEHGAQSKRAPVRQAASMALESLREAA
jgi:HEAT repeat protein